MLILTLLYSLCEYFASFHSICVLFLAYFVGSGEHVRWLG